MTLEAICDNRLCPVFNYFSEANEDTITSCPTCHTGAAWINNRSVRHIPKDLRSDSRLCSDSMTKGEHQRKIDMANRRHKIATHVKSIRRIVVTNWRNQ